VLKITKDLLLVLGVDERSEGHVVVVLDPVLLIWLSGSVSGDLHLQHSPPTSPQDQAIWNSLMKNRWIVFEYLTTRQHVSNPLIYMTLINSLSHSGLRKE
jgi:hypothetical protein